MRWIGFRAPWAGMADVSVDGGAVARIDLYSATEAVQTPVFTATGLAAGAHTLRIDVPGEKNPAGELARQQQEIAKQAQELAKNVAQEQGQGRNGQFQNGLQKSMPDLPIP